MDVGLAEKIRKNFSENFSGASGTFKILKSYICEKKILGYL